MDRRATLKMMLCVGSAMAVPMLARAGMPAQRRGHDLYRDARAPIPDRVRDLLGRMTLEEKVMQMIALWAAKSEIMDGMAFGAAKASSAYPAGLGQLTRASDKRGVQGVAGGRAPPSTAAARRSRRSTSSTRCSAGRRRGRG